MKILFRSREISYKVLRPFKKITIFRVSRPCILEVRGIGIGKGVDADADGLDFRMVTYGLDFRMVTSG